MHLTKKLKDLYKENFKSLKKETDTYTSRLADLLLWKWPSHQKQLIDLVQSQENPP